MSVKALIWASIGMTLSMGLTAHWVSSDMARIRAEQQRKTQLQQQQSAPRTPSTTGTQQGYPPTSSTPESTPYAPAQ